MRALWSPDMMDIEQKLTLEIGPHHARFFPPDLVRVRWVGTASAEVIDALFQWSDELVGDARYFVIADVTNLDAVGPATRKAAAADTRSIHIAGIAFVGASAYMRALMVLFTKALGLFYGEDKFRAAFFDEEAEALAWVNATRAELGPASQARPRARVTSG
ncbi:STAS/SEC14 domain-containing protein [Polyangium spumosum]|uniref:STAS/SEC14 domain-containing protein n=1 Tax=Polyangium spumosum TaxID=889282 RepID=A0A6N7Q1V1_9BACT|nr:STAS/SEC14 domain-containing protein [Polyangium spumosum]MRG96234.1 hypothetical protein [Polyangium spumosum]